MSFGGIKTSFIRYLGLFVPLFFVVLLFQNCGIEGDQSESLFVGSDYKNNGCLSETVDCGASADFLQITLDMPDNMVYDSASVSKITVNGRCNDGNFADYYIDWVVLNPDYSVKASGSEFDVCVRGKYQFPITINTYSLSTNYTLKVKMIGRDTEGLVYENVSNFGSAQKDFSKK